MKYQVQITQEITAQQIADLMICAIEGNVFTRSWCEGVYLVSHEIADELENPWYSDPRIYEKEFTIKIVEYGDGDNLDHHICDQDDFLKGLNLIHTKNPSQFQCILEDKCDANTGDVFLQYVALGEEVYG